MVFFGRLEGSCRFIRCAGNQPAGQVLFGEHALVGYLRVCIGQRCGCINCFGNQACLLRLFFGILLREGSRELSCRPV
jgi:hypothetical protein